MNITEVTTEGLRRELKVVVGADELERRLSARLDDLSGRVRIKGFRPGHGFFPSEECLSNVRRMNFLLLA